MHFFRVAIFASLVLSASADPPLILFGGVNPGKNRTGFLFPDVKDAPDVSFVTSVNSVICSHKEKVVVGTDDSVSDAAPEVDKVAVERLDGVKATIEVSTRLDATTIASGMIMVGGVFPGGLVLWDRFGVQNIGPGALNPPCVFSIAYSEPLKGPPHDSIIVGGCFRRMGTMVLNGIAMIRFAPGFLPTNEHPTWLALGEGLSTADGGAASVYSVAAMNNYIYAGGEFDKAGNVPAANIARYDRYLGTWSDVGGGVDGIVRAIAPSPHSAYNGVYLGGSFCAKNQQSACNIAYWNAETGWAILGNGIQGEVLSLLLVGPALYVGGQFVCPDTIKSNLAVWMESDAQWFPGPLPGGRSPGVVRTMGLCPCGEGAHVDDETGDCVYDSGDSTSPSASAWRKSDSERFITPHRGAAAVSIASTSQEFNTPHLPHRSTWLGALIVIGVIVVLAGPVTYVIWKRHQREIATEQAAWKEITEVQSPEGVPLMTYRTYGQTAGGV